MEWQDVWDKHKHRIKFGGRDGMLEEHRFEFGGDDKGWAPLVDQLITDLFTIGWDGHLYQVKQKFGGLRFYIGQGPRETFDRIAQAEKDSEKTCEVCGEPGSKRNTGGWLQTLCDKHYEQAIAERAAMREFLRKD